MQNCTAFFVYLGIILAIIFKNFKKGAKMNRFFAFLLILCTVLCTFSLPTGLNFAQSFEGVYYFYTSQNYQSEITHTVKNGNGYIISCDISCAQVVQNALNPKCLYGESFVFKGDNNDIENLLFSLDITYRQNNDLDIIAYSPKISYAMTVEGKPFNVQISKQQEFVSVGFPAILGGF